MSATTERFPAPKKMMQPYTYRGFTLVVFASGRTMVHYDNKAGTLADCKTAEEAAAWVDLYMD